MIAKIIREADLRPVSSLLKGLVSCFSFILISLARRLVVNVHPCSTESEKSQSFGLGTVTIQLIFHGKWTTKENSWVILAINIERVCHNKLDKISTRFFHVFFWRKSFIYSSKERRCSTLQNPIFISKKIFSFALYRLITGCIIWIPW